MPLTSPTESPPGPGRQSPGSLYVVATPIGHMEDITLRAIRVLQEVSLIAAEDTRHTGKLLVRHGIRTPLISLHDHNKEKRAPQLLAKLMSGTSVALVSDAGTPSVSDPGYYLVNRCLEKGVPVVPVPGASAAIAALSVSGLPSDSFVFIGFVPRKKTRRRALLDALKHEPRTLIFYESPKRVLPLMEELVAVMGDRHAVLARELTKIHEEILRGPLTKISAGLSDRTSVKGECTLLISGAAEGPQDDGQVWREALRALRQEGKQSLSQAAKEVAQRFGLNRKQVYDAALDMEKDRQ